jgi:2-polyprenyl-6-methoxyphenol hydroxylase-like FAD-dependent oxidoreductase
MRAHGPAVVTAPGERSNRASVGVIGGGIGGLSAALSLLQAGFEVQVYEQAPMLGEVGAGLQVSPNAARVLHRLGLAEELARTGVKPVAWHQRRFDDGRTLLRTPLAAALEAAFGYPQYQIHRADLLAALADALPADRIHLGHQLTDLTDRGDHIQARFGNGAHVELELLVGADGIHSTVRNLLFGSQQPHFTGCVAYRGLVPADRLADLELEVTAQLWMGRAATSSTTSSETGACSASWPSSSSTAGPGSHGPKVGIWPTPVPPSPAGTPRSGPSWTPPTTASAPPCSTAPRWSAGRSAG